MTTGDLLAKFIQKYFIEPGYDWVDTPTYGLVLGLCTLGLIKLLKKLGLRLELRLLAALTPYIMFGATTRELVDQGLGVYGLFNQNPPFWLVSPGIFASMFLATTAVIAFSIAMEKITRLERHKTILALGLVPMAYNLGLVLVNINSITPLATTLLFTAGSLALIYALSRIKQLNFLRNKDNMLVLGAHLLDASATYTGLFFLGLSEQHVLPNLLISKLGNPAVMFPLKILVLVPALYLIDKELGEDETTRRFIKLVILILGIGPAIRDITLMLLL